MDATLIRCLPNPDADEQNQRDRTIEGQLDRVPRAQQHYEVAPAGTAGLDGRHAPVGSEQVRDREKHRRDAPAQTSSGASAGDEEVGGRVAKDAVDADAGRAHSVTAASATSSRCGDPGRRRSS